MKSSLNALCRLCRTLADPICECGAIASATVSTGLVLFSDNLSQVSLTTVWRDHFDKIVWVSEGDLLAKARVSTIYDIQFTKDIDGTL